MILAWLGLLLALVLLLPFLLKPVEERLELFLLAAGIVAASLSHAWSGDLLLRVAKGGLGISAAVLLMGFAFNALRRRIGPWVRGVAKRFGPGPLCFLLVSGLGFASALITSVIAALVFAEAVTALRLSRRAELKLSVLACFSIGFGSALTPLGGPLAALALARLGEGFLFLTELLLPWAIPVIFSCGAAAFWLHEAPHAPGDTLSEDKPESAASLSLRALKLYGFVAALDLLGEGFRPFAERHLDALPGPAMYWINTSSAFLDNATLAAAEFSPGMGMLKLRYVLLGLLFAGGMMVPGNLPNIICASKLGIRSGEWAKFGVPLGLGLMALVFPLIAYF